MHADLTIQIGTSNSDWLSHWGPLVGVAVGALLAGVFSIFTTWRTHKSQLLQDALKVRRLEYFAAMDAGDEMRRALTKFVSAISGRAFNPEPHDHSPEAEEARRKDSAGAAAIDHLSDARDALQRQVDRIEAVGSAEVSVSSSRLTALIAEYFNELRARGDGVMKAARANKLREDFDAQMKVVAGLIRHDLQVDKIYRSRARPSKPSKRPEPTPSE